MHIEGTITIPLLIPTVGGVRELTLDINQRTDVLRLISAVEAFEQLLRNAQEGNIDGWKPISPKGSNELVIYDPRTEDRDDPDILDVVYLYKARIGDFRVVAAFPSFGPALCLSVRQNTDEAIQDLYSFLQDEWMEKSA